MTLLPRFSLRSLILFVALATSGYGLYRHLAPWVCIRILEGHDGAINTAAFNPDETRIATASDDKTVRTWDAETGKPILTLRNHRREEVLAAAFSMDGERIISIGEEGTAYEWDSESGTLLRSSQASLYIRDYSELWGTPRIRGAYLPQGHNWVVDFSLMLEEVLVLDAETFSRVSELKGHEPGVSSFACSPDNIRIMTWRNAGIAWAWHATTGQLLMTFTGHSSRINDIAFTSDGMRLITAGQDGTARIWRRRRPEYWWGIAWLPEFWLTAVLGLGLLYSVWRDQRTFRRLSVT